MSIIASETTKHSWCNRWKQAPNTSGLLISPLAFHCHLLFSNKGQMASDLKVNINVAERTNCVDSPAALGNTYL